MNDDSPIQEDLEENIDISTTSWTVQNVTRLSNTTEEATIAYFVQISDSSLPLTLRLLTKIHHPLNVYALHFDKKIPSYRVLGVVKTISENENYTNVHIMPRESVTYRGITMILNNLAAMEYLEDLADWDYFINLSGSDYPLVAPATQRKILALPYVRDRNSNFFTTSPPNQWEQNKRFRYHRIAVDLALGMSDRTEDSSLLLLDEKMPLFDRLHFDYVKGEGWVILTRQACKFIMGSAYARKMLLSMAFSQDPSEHFYVSLFWNHPALNRTIVPHSLRTVYWKLNGVYSGQHPYVIDQLRQDNGTYTVWKWLRRSPHFFARKFSNSNAPILDMIDNEMNGLGNDVNQTAVTNSLRRVEGHLHWIFGFLPEPEHNDASNNKNWPVR